MLPRRRFLAAGLTGAVGLVSTAGCVPEKVVAGKPVKQSAVPPGIDSLIDELQSPAARMEPAPGTPDIQSSYLGGHPYWPAGSEWPLNNGEPMAFVCQVNFAEVPPLQNFPASGIMQWFVGNDDVAGATFDDTAGTKGFALHWHSDTAKPSTKSVRDATPCGDRGENFYQYSVSHPLPIRIVFDPVITLPDRPELFTAEQLRSWRTAVEQAGFVDPAELADPDTADWALFRTWIDAYYELIDTGVTWSGAQIGGHPNFVQEDPRGTGHFAAVGDPSGALLIRVGGSDLVDWWAGGNANLFGDPRQLGHGDFSTVRYHTDR